MSIVNVMEVFVEQKMEEILSTTDCCTCDKCLDDMRAMALNKLPARYVSTDRGKLFSKLNSLKEQQNSVDINVAVLSAIEFVSANPRHSQEQENDHRERQKNKANSAKNAVKGIDDKERKAEAEVKTETENKADTETKSESENKTED